MTPEEQLLSAQSGNREALGRLLIEHRGLVAAVVRRFVGDAEQRKDVIQNIFFKVVKHISRFGGASRFSTWLYRISLNECMEAGRSRKRDTSRHETLYDDRIDLVNPDAPDALKLASSRELRIEIGVLLESLPLDQKTAFSLFYFAGYSGKECAEVLHLTPASFFMKLKTARDAVRRGLCAKGWSA